MVGDFEGSRFRGRGGSLSLSPSPSPRHLRLQSPSFPFPFGTPRTGTKTCPWPHAEGGWPLPWLAPGLHVQVKSGGAISTNRRESRGPQQTTAVSVTMMVSISWRGATAVNTVSAFGCRAWSPIACTANYRHGQLPPGVLESRLREGLHAKHHPGEQVSRRFRSRSISHREALQDHK